MKKILLVILLIPICVNVVISEPAKPLPQKKNDNSNSQVMLNNKSMKTFLEKIEIYGRIAKPQTVFIIPGADPRVDGIRIERRFFGNMFRKVEKSTLRKQKIKEQRTKDHILW